MLRLQGALLHEGEVRWGDLHLRQRLQCCAELPDSALITSARAVVLRGPSVVVVSANGQRHVMPGGRLEAGESPDAALRREVIEESGWTLGPTRLFALLHFHHLTPKPAGHPYPYPDFLQPVFLAEGQSHSRKGLKRAGEIETGARLMRHAAAWAVIGPEQQALLRAALAARNA